MNASKVCFGTGQFRLILFCALIAVALSGCSANRLYSGPDESVITISGFVESVDGLRFEKRRGAHIVAPGIRMIKIGHGWPDLSNSYYALKVDPGKKYTVKSYRVSTISGTEIRKGWNFAEVGSSEKPTYKWCGPKPIEACNEGEKTHECVRRQCLRLGW